VFSGFLAGDLIKTDFIDPSFAKTAERVSSNLPRRTKRDKVAQSGAKMSQSGAGMAQNGPKWRKNGAN
jgi:Ribonuclease G/E